MKKKQSLQRNLWRGKLNSMSAWKYMSELNFTLINFTYCVQGKNEMKYERKRGKKFTIRLVHPHWMPTMSRSKQLLEAKNLERKNILNCQNIESSVAEATKSTSSSPRKFLLTFYFLPHSPVKLNFIMRKITHFSPLRCLMTPSKLIRVAQLMKKFVAFLWIEIYIISFLFFVWHQIREDGMNAFKILCKTSHNYDRWVFMMIDRHNYESF